MKNMFWLILGILVGATSCVIFCRFFSHDERRYFELQSDYKIETHGTLKKGTLLQYDRSYPEGFTRYIMYVNLKDTNVKEHKSEHEDEIIPYWLEKE